MLKFSSTLLDLVIWLKMLWFVTEIEFPLDFLEQSAVSIFELILFELLSFTDSNWPSYILPGIVFDVSSKHSSLNGTLLLLLIMFSILVFRFFSNKGYSLLVSSVADFSSFIGT